VGIYPATDACLFGKRQASIGATSHTHILANLNQFQARITQISRFKYVLKKTSCRVIREIRA
ncbi:hypothetical protein, partial [uncultured Parabacteroides sp.]